MCDFSLNFLLSPYSARLSSARHSNSREVAADKQNKHAPTGPATGVELYGFARCSQVGQLSPPERINFWCLASASGSSQSGPAAEHLFWSCTLLRATSTRRKVDRVFSCALEVPTSQQPGTARRRRQEKLKCKFAVIFIWLVRVG